MLSFDTDEGRPKCQRCQKGFFICLGYSREWVFRNEYTSTRSEQRQARKAHPESSSRKLSLCSNSKISPFSDTTPVDSQCQALSLPPTFSLHGLKEDIVFSHLEHKLFLEHTETSDGARGPANPWFSHIRQVFANHCYSGAYLSILAVAVGFFARVHKNESLQENGSRIYGLALQRVMDEIKNPGRVDACSAVTAPLCLCIYELVSSIDENGRQIDELRRSR